MKPAFSRSPDEQRLADRFAQRLDRVRGRTGPVMDEVEVQELRPRPELAAVGMLGHREGEVAEPARGCSYRPITPSSNPYPANATGDTGARPLSSVTRKQRSASSGHRSGSAMYEGPNISARSFCTASASASVACGSKSSCSSVRPRSRRRTPGSARTTWLGRGFAGNRTPISASAARPTVSASAGRSAATRPFISR